MSIVKEAEKKRLVWLCLFFVGILWEKDIEKNKAVKIIEICDIKLNNEKKYDMLNKVKKRNIPVCIQRI